MVFAACSSSSSTAPVSGDAGSSDAASTNDGSSGDAASTSDGATDAPIDHTDTGCGLVLYTAEAAPACQLILDQYCCSQERTCGSDVSCRTYVACVDACPSPRQTACITACGAVPGKLDALSTCTKTPPYTTPPGITCAWP